MVILDVIDSLVESLQNTKSYTVTELSTEGSKVNTITGYRAINSKHHEDQAVQEIATAELVGAPRPSLLISDANWSRSRVPWVPTS